MVLYSLIIVDDDELIRKGIEKVIPWDKLGFSVKATFPSAVAAFEFLKKEDADVILTDVKMPKMTGLELIEEAKRLNSNCKAVVISGFSEFDLVKSALTLKAEDYLLKPLSQSDIEKVFTKIAKVLDAERNKSLGDNVVSDCYELVKTLSNEFKLWEEAVSRGLEKIKYKLCLVIYEGEDVSRNIESALASFHHATRPGCFAWLSPENDFSNLVSAVSDILKSSKCVYRMMVGSDVFWIDDIVPSFWAAFDLYSGSEPSSISFYSDKHDEEALRLACDGRGILIKVIEKGDQAALEIALSDMVSKIKLLSEEEQGYAYCAIVTKLLRYFAIDNNLEQFQCAGRILTEKKDMEDKFLRDVRMLQRTLSSKSDSNSKLIIAKTKKIIGQRFSDPYLSLSQIADELGISYGYLSTIFTKTEGKSFKAFLIDVRMDEARALLLSRKYRIYEIADMVGYSSTRYFTEAFHKYYGCSPVDYLQKSFLAP